VVYGYGYQTATCSCGDTMKSSPVKVDMILTNAGGMNIFYWSTDNDHITENLYSSCTKHTYVKGITDGSGDLPVYVSANYNNNFTLGCGACTSDASSSNVTLISLILGGIAGLAFALGAALRG